jgi:hypothetical protein
MMTTARAMAAGDGQPRPCLMAGHDGPAGGCTEPATVEAGLVEAGLPAGGPYAMCRRHALDLVTATLLRGAEITLRPL